VLSPSCVAHMSDASEEAVLLALDTREELFQSLYDMMSSDNYVEILMAVKLGKTQSDLAEEVGVGTGTVSRAMNQLEEFGLVEEGEDGYEKALSALEHPMLQHYFYEEVVVDD